MSAQRALPLTGGRAPATWASNGRPKPWNAYHLGSTGWRIEHCGHPTANFPYIVIRPDGSSFGLPNGRGCRTLQTAKAAVERERGKA